VVRVLAGTSGAPPRPAARPEARAASLPGDGGVRAPYGGPLRDARLEDIAGHDRWIVAWVADAVNTLTSSFSGDSLGSAHLEARAFELP
jgi:hypothetical protein